MVNHPSGNRCCNEAPSGMIVHRPSNSGSVTDRGSGYGYCEGTHTSAVMTSTSSSFSSSSSSFSDARYHHSRMAIFVVVTLLTIVCSWHDARGWNRELLSYYRSSPTLSRGGWTGNYSFYERTDGQLQNRSHYFGSVTPLAALEGERAGGKISPIASGGYSHGGMVGEADELTDAQKDDLYGMDFRFCGQKRVSAKDDDNIENAESGQALALLYQCSGPTYDHFATNLHHLARNLSSSSLRQTHGKEFSNISNRDASRWGRWDFPLPDNVTVLALGNSHLRQISKTLACQYAPVLKKIQFLPSLPFAAGDYRQGKHDNGYEDDEMLAHDATKVGKPSPSSSWSPPPSSSSSSDAFVLDFDNGARWISITNTVLVYSDNWESLLEEYFLSSLMAGDSKSPSEPSPTPLRMVDMDAIVLGKFTTYEEATGTNFERTMLQEEHAFYVLLQQQQQQQQQQHGPLSPNSHVELTSKMSTKQNAALLAAATVVDFTAIPPPDLVDLARAYSGPIISVSMFSKSDVARAHKSYVNYDYELRRQQQHLESPPQNRHATVHNASAEMNLTGGGVAMLATIDSSPTDDLSSSLDKINQNVYRIDGRKYIDMLGLECGSDDKNTMGTCHEPPSVLFPASNEATEEEGFVRTENNHSLPHLSPTRDNTTNSPAASTTPSSTNHNSMRGPLRQRQLLFGYRDPSDMHRCAGVKGGHVDLVAWDIVEGLYYYSRNGML